jgi:hypothetical protein
VVGSIVLGWVRVRGGGDEGDRMARMGQEEQLGGRKWIVVQEKE